MHTTHTRLAMKTILFLDILQPPGPNLLTRYAQHQPLSGAFCELTLPPRFIIDKLFSEKVPTFSGVFQTNSRKFRHFPGSREPPGQRQSKTPAASRGGNARGARSGQWRMLITAQRADNVDHGAARKYSRNSDKYTGPDVLG